MRRRILALGIVGLIGTVSAFVFHDKVGHLVLELSLNRNLHEFFGGSIRVGKFNLDKHFKINIQELTGSLQSEAGPVPLEILSIESINPITDILWNKGLVLNFEGAQVRNSKYQGIKGVLQVKGGDEGSLDLKADVQGVGLEELEWLNPENLSGSSGEMKGEIMLENSPKGKILLHLKLRIEEPGGRVQARFFDLLTPYLPQLAMMEKVKEIKAKGGTVGFHDALIEVKMTQSKRIKIFLHMVIPDYNLHLNLNTEVRFEEEDTLPELARLIGLLKVEKAE
ncbi:MAG: hypothetical protein HY447_02955 [Candidatus Omnitrophica bacterium]|nr:hypothetical protein [Candidatus Omnitrophota bacterium]